MPNSNEPICDMCHTCEPVKLQSTPFDKIVNKIPFQKFMIKKTIDKLSKHN